MLFSIDSTCRHLATRRLPWPGLCWRPLQAGDAWSCAPRAGTGQATRPGRASALTRARGADLGTDVAQRGKGRRYAAHAPSHELEAVTASRWASAARREGVGLGSVARTGQSQFYAPVLRPALRRVVRSHGIGLAEPLRGHQGRVDALRDQELHHGVGPLLGQLLVARDALAHEPRADWYIVGIAVHQQRGLLLGGEDRDDFAEGPLGFRRHVPV